MSTFKIPRGRVDEPVALAAIDYGRAPVIAVAGEFIVVNGKPQLVAWSHRASPCGYPGCGVVSPHKHVPGTCDPPEPRGIDPSWLP